MTPTPLTDAEIDDFWSLGYKGNLCRAIESEVNRRWTEMLGKSEPVAYLAWKDGKPCYEGDDGVCEDAVWPVDFDDDRTSMPVYTHPAPDHTALLRQALEALEAGDDVDPIKAGEVITAIREQLK